MKQDWRYDYLITSAFILADTLIMTLFLSAVITKDSILKTWFLALGISLVSVVTAQDLYNKSNGQKMMNDVDITAFFFMIAAHLYIIAIGFISILIGIAAKITKDEKTKQKMKGDKYQAIILFSLVFAVIIVIFFFTSFDVSLIVSLRNFWAIVGVVLFSVVFLIISSKLIGKVTNRQAIKRKIFHLGPIIIIPVINFLNPQILVVILSPAFSLLLLLEVIRFQEQQLDEGQMEIHPILAFILGYMNVLFNWMGEFNKRQAHFWFTHLFLALSLLCSYQLPSVITPKMKFSVHVVLVFITADAVAAIIGGKFGRFKIFGNKTIEGTVAFILTCFIGSYLLTSLNTTQLTIISIVCGLSELYGGDADNILTLFAYYGVRLLFVLIVKIQRL